VVCKKLEKPAQLGRLLCLGLLSEGELQDEAMGTVAATADPGSWLDTTSKEFHFEVIG
jgi:hypothetical protein